eukprot:scaffold61345_cov23-Tisochrysis_lutea.AAC.2
MAARVVFYTPAGWGQQLKALRGTSVPAALHACVHFFLTHVRTHLHTHMRVYVWNAFHITSLQQQLRTCARCLSRCQAIPLSAAGGAGGGGDDGGGGDGGLGPTTG